MRLAQPKYWEVIWDTFPYCSAETADLEPVLGVVNLVLTSPSAAPRYIEVGSYEGTRGMKYIEWSLALHPFASSLKRCLGFFFKLGMAFVLIGQR